MTDLAYAVLAIGFVYLGVKLFMKFREIASWKSDDDLPSPDLPGSRPREVIDLQIEDPSDDLNASEESLERRNHDGGSA